MSALDHTLVLETERLALRHLSPSQDAEFLVELFNDPAFLRFVGDKGVRTAEDASAWVVSGPLASYATNGFGLYRTELKDERIPIGICGLVKRDALEDVDIGFGLLPEFRGRGYVLEAAAAVLAHGRTALGLTRIVAITHPDNTASAHVLGRLGLRFERMIRLEDGAPEIRLFGTPSPSA